MRIDLPELSLLKSEAIIFWELLSIVEGLQPKPRVTGLDQPAETKRFYSFIGPEAHVEQQRPPKL